MGLASAESCEEFMKAVLLKVFSVCSILLLSAFVFGPYPIFASEGDTAWRLNQDNSVTIYFEGVPKHSILLHWSIVDRPSHWLNVTDTLMVYDSQSGNYSVTVGPFASGTAIEWVFYDQTAGKWYNLEGKAYNNWSYTIGSPVAGKKLLRMSVFTNRYVYGIGDVLGITVSLRSLVPEKLDGIDVNSSVIDSRGIKVLQLPMLRDLAIEGLSSKELNQSAGISLSDDNYVIVSVASRNLIEIGRATVPLVVLDTMGKPPLTLAFVFHMHQPLYVNLQGEFEQPWAQLHCGGDFELDGRSYGAYLWHIYMLDRHPGIKVTFNLQPSLLYQWNLTLRDFRYNGSYPGGNQSLSRDIAAVNGTLEGYRRLASSGRIEILTSPFYHPLSAILVNLGWSEDLQAQMALGKNYTRTIMGVDAQGMWTPEMGFNLEMVPLIAKAGLKYTVLDTSEHFVRATGPSSSSSVYQPFVVEGANGTNIVVFFRDTDISNGLSFDWNGEINPKVAASKFIAAVARVYRVNPNGVLTVALDGENPIALARGLISALDFDEIYAAIEAQGWIKTSTMSDVLSSRKVTTHLTFVPSSSWSGGFGLWIGIPAKNAIWEAISKARGTLVNLTKRYGKDDPRIMRMWNYLYVAEGSDWEWQTPTGPAWFAFQGYRYAQAAMTLPREEGVPVFPVGEVYVIVGVAVVILVALFLFRRKIIKR